MRGRIHHLAVPAIVLLLALLSFAPAAVASHEKGGYLDVAIGANGHLTGHLQYIHTNSTGTCPYAGALALNGMVVSLTGPGGYTASPAVTGVTVNCTASSLAETGQFDADASSGADGIYTVRFTSCCRIAGIANTTDQNTQLSAAVRKQGTTPAGSPILSSQVALGISTQAPYSQNLNASDPDSAALGYVLLQGSDSSQATTYDVNAPTSNIVALDTLGQMTISGATTASLPVPGYYVTKVRVTDPDGGYAVRDVLMSTTTNRPPVIGGGAWVVQVIAGRTATTSFAASDADGGQTVAFDPAGLPGWAGFSATSGNPATATLTVSPPGGTPAQTIGVNIDAVDNDPTVSMRASRHLEIQVLATAPTVATTTAPASLSSDPRPTFELTPSLGGATMQCSLDGGAWGACATSWQPGADLGDGPHELRARVVLAGGATSDTTTYGWTIDATPPAAPTILSAPHGTVPKGPPARFEIAGEPDGHFECGLDNGIWKTCGSVEEFGALTPGGHGLAVRQVDSAGNAGPSTLVSWTVAEESGEPSPDPGTTPSRVDAITPAAIAVDGGTVEVGCRLDAGTIDRCEVRAYITVKRGGKAKRVLVGTGRTPQRKQEGGGAAQQGGGGREATVRVRLNGRGRKLACNAGGVKVTFDILAVAREGSSVRTSSSARVRTPRLIVVPSDGMFRSGHVDLMPRGQRALLRIAHRLVGVPAIRCTGHTDSVGPAAYNQQLGRTRATVTCRFLRRHGVRSQMRTASMGESRPRATNRTARGRGRNRRVEVSVTCDAGHRR